MSAKDTFFWLLRHRLSKSWFGAPLKWPVFGSEAQKQKAQLGWQTCLVILPSFINITQLFGDFTKVGFKTNSPKFWWVYQILSNVWRVCFRPNTNTTWQWSIIRNSAWAIGCPAVSSSGPAGDIANLSAHLTKQQIKTALVVDLTIWRKHQSLYSQRMETISHVSPLPLLDPENKTWFKPPIRLFCLVCFDFPNKWTHRLSFRSKNGVWSWPTPLFWPTDHRFAARARVFPRVMQLVSRKKHVWKLTWKEEHRCGVAFHISGLEQIVIGSWDWMDDHWTLKFTKDLSRWCPSMASHQVLASSQMHIRFKSDHLIVEYGHMYILICYSDCNFITYNYNNRYWSSSTITFIDSRTIFFRTKWWYLVSL